MRKFFNITAGITVALSCMFYYMIYVGLLLAETNPKVAGVIAMVGSIVVYSPLLKKVSEFIEKNRKRNTLLLFALVVILHALLSFASEQVNLNQALVSSAIQIALYGILIPIITHIVVTIWVNRSVKKTAEKLHSSNESLAVNVIKSAEESLDLEENKKITGEYDKDLSVKCDNGIFVGTKEKNVLSFKGIPYAKQPVGERRWKKPERMEKSDEVFEAKHFGKVALQPYNKIVGIPREKQGEDCLNLNIWTSVDKKHKYRGGKPVLVIFHSVDNVHGGCSTELLSGQTFIEDYPDIVVVSVNYRLGLLANMDFSSASGGEEYADSTHLGLLDQIEALHWIRRNIGKFGGDRENVTVFGNVGAAGSIVVLNVMPKAKGLYHRAIAWGGMSIYSISKKHGEELYSTFKNNVNASTMQDFISLTEDQIIETTESVYFKEYIGPIRNGTDIPENILNAYEEGKAADVNIIFGSISGELEILADIIGDKSSLTSFLINSGDPSMEKSEDDIKCVEEYKSRFFSNPATDDEIREFYEMVTIDMPIYLMCKKQSASEGQIRYVKWFNKYSGSWLKSQSLYVPFVLLDTIKGNEKYSVVGDPILQSATQISVVNFLKYGDPSVADSDKDEMVELGILPFTEENNAITFFTADGIAAENEEFVDKCKTIEPLAELVFNY